MAIAGRVAIVPKGEWSQSVTYDKLDLVTHNGNTFIAYKSSVGVTPVDGDTWMLVMQSIDPQEIDNIINGTTPVGNALKLGGKSASELSVKDADTVDGKHADDFLLRDGSVPMSGNTTIEKTSPVFDLRGTDSGRIARLSLGSSGLIGLLNMQDSNNYNGLYVRKDTDSLDIALQLIKKIGGTTSTYNVLHTGNMASHVLPLTGGNLTGLLRAYSKGHMSALVSYRDDTGIPGVKFENTNGTLGFIGATNDDTLIHLSKNSTVYTIHDNGNKPTGSYTGNGSATARTIQTGGIGNGVLINSSHGIAAIVTPHGTIYKNATTLGALMYTDGGFSNGVLTITSQHEALNASGVTYVYQVL